MRLTKFGHSCLLVEEGGARVLLDPGSFSVGFEQLEGLTAVCVTHQHVDHLDGGRVRRLLDRNPGVRVVSDEGSAEALGELGATPATRSPCPASRSRCWPCPPGRRG
jgi:L-ascorbate metabolism protein UlaG (beta-lactamase superfamily)